MTQQPFRTHHLLEFFKKSYDRKLPLDFSIHTYFREHKALGSKDRAFVAETAYALVRWQGLLQALGYKNIEDKIAAIETTELTPSLYYDKIARNDCFSFPKWLYESLVQEYGQEEGERLCLESNEAAPLFVRVNPTKSTRENLLQVLEEFSPTPTEQSPLGVVLPERVNLFGLEAFKQGLFEVQDEGSQLLALLVKPKPGDHVMDFCSGSGGKALAFAHKMEGKGQLYLHDIRKKALFEARKRLARAGIQNSQIVEGGDPKLKKLKKKMDWVLVDVPCSGSGTLRRNPDLKWKITPDEIRDLVGKQRAIFEQGLSYLKDGGKIVYGTCSILKEENEDQVAHFMKTYSLKVDETFKSVPKKAGMDGLFGVVLSRI